MVVADGRTSARLNMSAERQREYGRIGDEQALRAIVPDSPQRAWDKEQPAIDEDCAAFIAASPFAVLASADADGRCDASPRGGPPGFVSVLDPARLAVPDYTGNRRQDSHRNVLANPQVGVRFFVPGVKETLRVNGRATLSTDQALLAGLATGGAEAGTRSRGRDGVHPLRQGASPLAALGPVHLGARRLARPGSSAGGRRDRGRGACPVADGVPGSSAAAVARPPRLPRR